jgi:hypothetical protein
MQEGCAAPMGSCRHGQGSQGRRGKEGADAGRAFPPQEVRVGAGAGAHAVAATRVVARVVVAAQGRSTPAAAPVGAVGQVGSELVVAVLGV